MIWKRTRSLIAGVRVLVDVLVDVLVRIRKESSIVRNLMTRKMNLRNSGNYANVYWIRNRIGFHQHGRPLFCRQYRDC